MTLRRLVAPVMVTICLGGLWACSDPADSNAAEPDLVAAAEEQTPSSSTTTTFAPPRPPVVTTTLPSPETVVVTIETYLRQDLVSLGGESIDGVWTFEPQDEWEWFGLPEPYCAPGTLVEFRVSGPAPYWELHPAVGVTPVAANVFRCEEGVGPARVELTGWWEFVSLPSEAGLRNDLLDQFRSWFGREPTEEEYQAFVAEIHAQARANPERRGFGPLSMEIERYSDLETLCRRHRAVCSGSYPAAPALPASPPPVTGAVPPVAGSADLAAVVEGLRREGLEVWDDSLWSAEGVGVLQVGDPEPVTGALSWLVVYLGGVEVDRIEVVYVQDVTVDGDTLTVVSPDYGPNDPMCCPSGERTESYRVTADGAVALD